MGGGGGGGRTGRLDCERGAKTTSSRQQEAQRNKITRIGTAAQARPGKASAGSQALAARPTKEMWRISSSGRLRLIRHRF